MKKREEHFWKINIVIILLGAVTGWLVYQTFYTGPFYPKPLNSYLLSYDNIVHPGQRSCFTAVLEPGQAYDVNYTVSVEDNLFYKGSLHVTNHSTVSRCVDVPTGTSKVRIRLETLLGNESLEYVVMKTTGAGNKSTVRLVTECGKKKYVHAPYNPSTECENEKKTFSFYFVLGMILFLAPGILLFGYKGFEEIAEAIGFSAASFVLVCLMLERTVGISTLSVSTAWALVLLVVIAWRKWRNTLSSR